MPRAFLLMFVTLVVAGCGESRGERWRRLAADAVVPLTSPLMLEGTYRNPARGRPAFTLWDAITTAHVPSPDGDLVQFRILDGCELRAELFREGVSRDSITLPFVVKPDRLEIPRRVGTRNAYVILNSVSHLETDLGVNAAADLVMVGSGGGAAVFIVLPMDVCSGEFTATFERVAVPQPSGGPYQTLQ